MLEGSEPAYVGNLQYAILEVSDFYTSQESVLERESHWKKALCSGKYGYR